MAAPGNTFGQALQQPLTDSLKQSGINMNPLLPQSLRELSYKAFIVSHDKNILVEAWLPDTVATDVNARFETPYAQGITDGKIAGLARFFGNSLTTQALTIQVWQGGSEMMFSLPLIFQADSNGVTDVMKPIKDLLKLMMPHDSQTGGGGLLEAPGPHLDPSLLNNQEQRASIVKIAEDGISSFGSSLLDTAKSAITGNIAEAAGNALNGVINTANSVATPLSKAIVNSVKNNISLYIGQFQYFPSVVITDVSPTFDVVIGPDKNPLRASVIVQFKTFYTPTDEDIENMFPSATEGASGSGAVGLGSSINNPSAFIGSSSLGGALGGLGGGGLGGLGKAVTSVQGAITSVQDRVGGLGLKLKNTADGAVASAAGLATGAIDSLL